MTEHSVGDRVRDTWGWGTIVEVVDFPDATLAPRTRYRVDRGGGWTTVIWPQDIIEGARP